MMKQKFLLTILTFAVAIVFLPQVSSPLRAAGDDDDSKHAAAGERNHPQDPSI